MSKERLFWNPFTFTRNVITRNVIPSLRILFQPMCLQSPAVLDSGHLIFYSTAFELLQKILQIQQRIFETQSFFACSQKFPMKVQILVEELHHLSIHEFQIEMAKDQNLVEELLLKHLLSIHDTRFELAKG